MNIAKADRRLSDTTTVTKRRALWILNHKTLLPTDVRALKSLGVSVFTPKIVPKGHEFGYTVVTYEHDSELDLPQGALKLLNEHNFYENAWGNTLTKVINAHFSVCITSIHQVPFVEALSKFKGPVIARVLGRETPHNYSQTIAYYGVEGAVAERSEHFILAQEFDEIGEYEEPYLACRAATVGAPLPSAIWEQRGTWNGSGDSVLILCPINSNPYYEPIHRDLKDLFQGVPHRIFQYEPMEDPAVLPTQTDDELLELFRVAPVFAYQSTEPRHVHFSPIEAMVLGTPVLYLAGALIDTLAGKPLPGRCKTSSEMREKAVRLLNGDAALSFAIRQSQDAVTHQFSHETATSQWSNLLSRFGPLP
jgi:hypothetical protein